MGKRYFCDYCDRSFQDNLHNRKKHLNGVQHLRAKKVWYDLFRGGCCQLCETFTGRWVIGGRVPGINESGSTLVICVEYHLCHFVTRSNSDLIVGLPDYSRGTSTMSLGWGQGIIDVS